MATFITPKTCRNATKVTLSGDGRTLTVYKVVSRNKVGSNRIIGKHKDEVIICRYPATDYNKRVVWSNFGRFIKL